MTIEEALDRFEAFEPFCDDRAEACDHDCTKCEEMEVIIVESLKKQIPKKPIERRINLDFIYSCGNCGNELEYENQEICDCCGQAIDWSVE